MKKKSAIGKILEEIKKQSLEVRLRCLFSNGFRGLTDEQANQLPKSIIRAVNEWIEDGMPGHEGNKNDNRIMAIPIKNPEWVNGTFNTGLVRIVITNKDDAYPNTWVFRASGLGWKMVKEPLDLHADQPEEKAQEIVLLRIKDRLKAMLKSLT